ncbi:MAG TPA: hypothetical protein VL651_14145 [Bacteroidia bacterium]|jgi:hypothetical protein|nr:hypothetical protein [Bacteroidia bacterium]
MKKLFLFSLLLLPSSLLLSQSDSTFVGKWKCTVIVGESSRDSYIQLKNDSTFVAGADSSFSDKSKQTATGKWKLNPKGDIILVPNDTAMETHYFEHLDHWKFHYYLNERHGQTYPFVAMEMRFDIYLEKIVPKQKGKKKKVRAKY